MPSAFRRLLPRISSLQQQSSLPARIAPLQQLQQQEAEVWQPRRFIQQQPSRESDSPARVDPFTLVADEVASLTGRLRDMAATEVPKLASATEYLFKQGVEGKRFRPVVLLLMSSSLLVPEIAADITRQHKLAEITEMIHVVSLLHDDVLDDADTRRGIPSLNFVMGNKVAVHAGDFLFARAAFTLSTLRNDEVFRLMSKAFKNLVAGEVMQWSVSGEMISSMEHYLQKTFYKTGSLIAASCKSIAILAGQPQEVAELAFEYGRNLGVAYQLVDDLLDFTGSKASLGKPALSDLRQGLATAPVLYALEKHPGMLELMKRKFKNPGDVDAAVTMVMESEGLARTRELAREHSIKAADALAGFPPPRSERAAECRRALLDLTEQLLVFALEESGIGSCSAEKLELLKRIPQMNLTPDDSRLEIHKYEPLEG